MRRRAWISPLLLALCVAAQDARSEAPALWRWTDADGTARYTPDPSRVPSAQRGTLALVEAGMPAPPEPEHVLKPAAIFAPPGEPPLEADPFNAPAPARRIESEIVPPVPLQTEPHAASPAAEAVPPPTPPAPPRSEPVPKPAPAVAAAPAAAPAPKARPPAPPPSDLVPVAAVEPEIVSLEPGPPAATTAVPTLPAPAPAAAVPAGPSLPAPATVAAVPSEPPLPAPVTVVAVPAEPALPAPAPAAAVPTEPVAIQPAPDEVAVPEPAPAVTAALPPDLEARRAQLLMEIARDEEALKAHVSATGSEPLAPSPELREIAQRLPALQAELRALEAQRPGTR